MASMANLPLFTFFLLLGSWGSANGNALSQEKVGVYPKVPALTSPVKPPAPVKAPYSPVPPPPYFPSPLVKPPSSPLPPVKAPYTPSPPVKVPSSPPAKAPYVPSPPLKPPSSPPPAKAPYVPSPPLKPPSSPPTAKAPYIPSPPPAKAPYTPAPPVNPPSPAAPKPPPVLGKECYPLCGRRCEVHSRTNVCIRACVTCCYRCKCVPPGTYGNREVCGKCYTDMTTHGNRIKCP